MRILITNDDSISAKQLLPLIRYCRKFGEVTVSVPKYEQSGKSHGIELHQAFSVGKQFIDKDIEAYVVDSTPADCVRFAVLGLGIKFDLVISGVNRGFNMGTDVTYSGTIAGVREAMLQRISAIALSTSPENYDNAVKDLDMVFDYIFGGKLLEKHGAYNINIPPNPKGIRITRQGSTYYTDSFVEVAEGMYKVMGECVYRPSGDLTLDTDSVTSGYISVMPITTDITDKEIFSKLTGAAE